MTDHPYEAFHPVGRLATAPPPGGAMPPADPKDCRTARQNI